MHNEVLVYYSANYLKAYYVRGMNYSVMTNSLKLKTKAIQLCKYDER